MLDTISITIGNQSTGELSIVQITLFDIILNPSPIQATNNNTNTNQLRFQRLLLRYSSFVTRPDTNTHQVIINYRKFSSDVYLTVVTVMFTLIALLTYLDESVSARISVMWMRASEDRCDNTHMAERITFTRSYLFFGHLADGLYGHITCIESTCNGEEKKTYSGNSRYIYVV